jgi:protein TorT
MCVFFSLIAFSNANAEEKQWWPLEIFTVTDAPQNVGIGEKMESGVVSYEQYTPPMKAKKPFRIGVLFPHLKDPYWLGPAYGIAEEAKRLGVSMTLLSAGGYENNIKQIDQLEDLAVKGVDGVIIVPLSYTAQDNAIAKLHQQGIPVVELLNDCRTDELVTKVGTSFVQMGYAAGKLIIEDAQKNGLKKVNTAYFPGPAGAAWAEYSWKGFKQAIDESPIPVENLAVKWGEMAKELQIKMIEDVLMTFGDKVHYIAGDALAAGVAIIPIREKGFKGKIKIVSVDLSDYVIPWIKTGDILAGSSTQGVYQARLAMNILVDVLNGDKNIDEIPDVMGANVQILTQNNFDEFPMDAIVAPKGFSPVFKVDVD